MCLKGLTKMKQPTTTTTMKNTSRLTLAQFNVLCVSVITSERHRVNERDTIASVDVAIVLLVCLNV